MRQLMQRVMMAALVGSAVISAEGRAQESLAMADRAPRFYVNATPEPVRLDASRTAVLRKRISVDLRGVKLGEALEIISRQSGLRLMYSWTVVPVDREVTLMAEGITVAGALSEVLFDAGVDVLFERDGQAAIVKRGRGNASRVVGSIAGLVTDSTSGRGIPGVTLRVENNRLSALTRDDGSYELTGVPAGQQRVVAQRLGYSRRTQTVEVQDNEEVKLDLALAPLVSALDRVVVTATGDHRRRELGHMVGTINADSLVKQAPVSSFSELLTARVSGLQVIQTSGTVGGDVRVQIRGANSIALGNDPIVIIDGIRYSTNRLVFGNIGPMGAELTSPLNDVNPNDIASIEVVKGPAAATLYGTDAANGVVVITTKRGEPGPARWRAYAKAGTTRIPTDRIRDTWYGYGRRTSNNAPTNCGLQSVASGFCIQDSVVIVPNPLKNDRYSIFQPAPSYAFGTNVSGGHTDLRYYFGLDVENAVGPVRMPPAFVDQLKAERGVDRLPNEWLNPNSLDKLSLRANVTTLFGKQGGMDAQVGYVHGDIRALPNTSNNNPYASPTGAFGSTPTKPYGSSEWSSPARAFTSTSDESTDRFFASATGRWAPLPWLTARSTAGIDFDHSDRIGLQRRGDTPDASYRDGVATHERTQQVATSVDLGATATARLGLWSLRTSAGAQYVRTFTDRLGVIGRNLPAGATDPTEAVIRSSFHRNQQAITLGSYVEETLALNERLFLTGALRADGASTFGQDYGIAIYPKVSASWIVSEEPFFPRVPTLGELRFRYAFGTSGQQPQQAWSRLAFQRYEAMLNGSSATVIGMSSLGNPELRPERVREHEYGVDVALVENRVQLGLAWYDRHTRDQIVSHALPPGLGSIYTNLGLTTQKGFELELSTKLLDTRYLGWDVMLHHGSHRTKLVDIGGGQPRYTFNGGYVEGYPLGARFWYPILGYEDVNGDGILVRAEVEQGDEMVYMGESTPPVSQALTSSVSLLDRRLRISTLFERRADFTQWDQLRENTGTISRAHFDPTAALADQAVVASRSYIEPADFTRLRELSVSLVLPQRVLRAVHAHSATMTLAGRNLALWTRYSGPDPESSRVSYESFSSGAYGTPHARTWTLRLDLGW